MSHPLLVALTLSSLFLVFSCSSQQKTQTPQVARAGVDGITIPTCAYCPFPEYSEEARKAKVQGTVTVQAVVTLDGRAEKISVVQGLGSGLDEKAIEVVKNWRFNPAHNAKGQPVAAEVPMHVFFKL
jgi:periplasmic protein TonB